MKEQFLLKKTQRPLQPSFSLEIIEVSVVQTPGGNVQVKRVVSEEDLRLLSRYMGEPLSEEFLGHSYYAYWMGPDPAPVVGGLLARRKERTIEVERIKADVETEPTLKALLRALIQDAKAENFSKIVVATSLPEDLVIAFGFLPRRDGEGYYLLL